MEYLNYYNKTHRQILRLTGHMISDAIKTDIKADLQTLLTTHNFLSIELADIISRLNGYKKGEHKLASILSQIVDILTLLRRYECKESYELQAYIHNSIRNYFKLLHSPHLFSI